MKTKITKLKEVGFCYGVKRAIDLMTQTAAENRAVDCLGELVHNPPVMQKLHSMGIRIIKSAAEIASPVAAISAHGVSPQIEAEMRSKPVKILDTTCPSVKAVQKAVARLVKNGYFIILFGDPNHAEVKGLVGWADNRAIVTTDSEKGFDDLPAGRKFGIVSQTTQVPEKYLAFVKDLLDKLMTGNKEITILDTVCQEVRRRQQSSKELAGQSDLMVVVGGRNSANCRRLVEICSPLVETHAVENADEIDSTWVKGKRSIGVTSATSASQESIDAVIARLESMTE
ncbi:MAG TPA: 4-hydroxy-3-methylbut-2-enyl diphosphate reductase [Dehalococcoidales bacterium]|nr:4-hydroxy-3-methylbut-2-enyl diphosphate reductase [Dehalococcoidales bacterium]